MNLKNLKSYYKNKYENKLYGSKQIFNVKRANLLK